MASGGEITNLLAALARGDHSVEADFVALVYPDFHALARHRMNRERPDHTLQPTALVNEAYLRLLGKQAPDWKNRAHFFAAASIVMRRILVDHARERGAARRPAANRRVELHDAIASHTPQIEQLLLIDEALSRLAEWDARQARVVEMVYFGGMTEHEVAIALDLSERTVRRDWRAARAWLQARLSAATS